MKKILYALPLVLAGCAAEDESITYICEEPLDGYLELARSNIAKDYEVDRSSRVLSVCPDKGFHRRYTFSFQPSNLVSRQATDASVEAAWCSDSGTRTADAEMSTTSTMLTFRFNYPWSTATGKYPRTEFRLDRTKLRGGFFDDLAWSCRLRDSADNAG